MSALLATPLTPQQERVLALIAAGSTTIGAGREAGVHRNTVNNWLHNEIFRQALDSARAEKQILYRDQAEALAADAISILCHLMYDPKSGPSIQYRAANTLLQHATSCMTGKNGNKLPDIGALKSENLHKTAQPEKPMPVRVTKIGRNEACPCGSGRKYKHCCLNAPAPPPANPQPPSPAIPAEVPPQAPFPQDPA